MNNKEYELTERLNRIERLLIRNIEQFNQLEEDVLDLTEKLGDHIRVCRPHGDIELPKWMKKKK